MLDISWADVIMLLLNDIYEMVWGVKFPVNFLIFCHKVAEDAVGLRLFVNSLNELILANFFALLKVALFFFVDYKVVCRHITTKLSPRFLFPIS